MGKTVLRLTKPYDPVEMDEVLCDRGAVILSGAYSTGQCDLFVAQVRSYLAEHQDEAEYATNSILGRFLGDTTVTLHQLIGAIPCAPEMVLQRDILDCARRVLGRQSDSILLVTSEYMARQPGTVRQWWHRDTHAWQRAHRSDPIAVSIMAAMSDFTAENGATWVLLDSHPGRLASVELPDWNEAVQATMTKGDALLFRSDLFHAGGANDAESDVRYCLSMGFQVAWLRQVENSTLSVPPAEAALLQPELQELLGYSNELVLGLYKGGDPKNALPTRT